MNIQSEPIKLPEDTPMRTIAELAGLSLRDYFAAAALGGMLAHPESRWGFIAQDVKNSFLYADAMLKQREVKK